MCKIFGIFFNPKEIAQNIFKSWYNLLEDNFIQLHFDLWT